MNAMTSILSERYRIHNAVCCLHRHSQFSRNHIQMNRKMRNMRVHCSTHRPCIQASSSSAFTHNGIQRYSLYLNNSTQKKFGISNAFSNVRCALASFRATHNLLRVLHSMQRVQCVVTHIALRAYDAYLVWFRPRERDRDSERERERAHIGEHQITTTSTANFVNVDACEDSNTTCVAIIIHRHCLRSACVPNAQMNCSIFVNGKCQRHHSVQRAKQPPSISIHSFIAIRCNATYRMCATVIHVHIKFAVC